MNKKSAISKKPTEQKQVDDFINKGIADEDKTAVKKTKNEVIRVQLRLDRDKLEEIDNAVNNRKVKISRHLWLLEAIEEKLEREMSN